MLCALMSRASHTRRPHAEVLWPKDKASKHPAAPAKSNPVKKTRPARAQASPFTRQPARGLPHSQVPSPFTAMGIRTGRCKLPRWVVYKWHLAAPRSALLAKQQSTCHGWQKPDGKGETLPENRSDTFQGPTLPIRVVPLPCGKSTLPVRLHLPSICSRADNPGAGG